MILKSTFLHENLLIIFLALFTALIGLYSYKSMSVLLPIMVISAIGYTGRIKKSSPLHSPPLIFFTFLLVWIGLSVFWTENQVATLRALTSLTFTFIFSLLLFSCALEATPVFISKVYTFLKLTGFLLISFIVFQLCIDTFLREVINITYKGATYMERMKPVGSILGLTVFVSCAFLWIYKNKFFSVFTFLLILNLIFLTRCQTAAYGVIFSIIVFALSYSMPFWTTRIALISSYTISLLSPLLYTYILPPSIINQGAPWKYVINHSLFSRILAWEYYSKKFFEKPFLGWGAESSRYLYTPEKPEIIPGLRLLHPHNNSIQAYVELGLVGGILYSLFFASLFYLVEKHVKDRLSVAVCNSTIAFGFIGAEITHNAWRNYWLSLAALTASLIILFIKAREAQLRAPTDHSIQPLAL